MILFIIIGGVIVVAIGVFGFLLYLLSKEGEIKKEEPLSALRDVGDLKKSLTGLSSEQQLAQILKVPVGAPVAAITPSFEAEKALAIQEAQHQKKVEELQKELQNIAETAQEQSKEALTTIEELKKENEKLRSEQNTKETAVAAKVIQAEQEVQAMREEQANLQTRLNDSQMEVGKLQDEVIAIKHKMGEEVFKTKTEVELLTTENFNLKKNLDEAVSKAVESFQQEMKILKDDNEALQATNQGLIASNNQLKESNAGLLEKSEKLEWDLTKTRAQATSFERASENHQAQLQEALNRIAALEKDLKDSKVNSSVQSNPVSEESA